MIKLVGRSDEIKGWIADIPEGTVIFGRQLLVGKPFHGKPVQGHFRLFHAELFRVPDRLLKPGPPVRVRHPLSVIIPLLGDLIDVVEPDRLVGVARCEAMLDVRLVIKDEKLLGDLLGGVRAARIVDASTKQVVAKQVGARGVSQARPGSDYHEGQSNHYNLPRPTFTPQLSQDHPHNQGHEWDHVG